MQPNTFTVKSVLLKITFGVLSGILLAASWPPSSLFFLSFFGLIPLLVLRDSIGSSQRSLVIYTSSVVVALFIWNAYTTQWIYKTFFTSGIVINCINITLFTIPWLLYFLSRKHLVRYQQYALLVGSWISLELMHYYWGLAFPYLNLGNVLAPLPALAQWYEYTGVFGGSLWVWGANILLFELIRELSPAVVRRVRRIRLITLLAGWILVPVALSAFIYSTYEEPGNTVNVVAVHPNMNCHKERQLYTAEQTTKVHWDLTKPLLNSDTDYILWPENAINLGWLNELPLHPQIQMLRDSLSPYPNSRLVMGAILYEQYQPTGNSEIPVNARSMDVGGQQVWYNTYNSALQLGGKTDIQLRTKIHLAPLEETTVYPIVVNFFRKFIPSLGKRSFSTRTSNQDVFKSQTSFTPLICYESLFGHTTRRVVREGADLLFVILNEGWMDDDQQAAQFMQYASLRAIENRRSIVRSSNKGFTCFIDQRGVVQQSVTSNSATAISGEVQTNRAKTFYTLAGDYVAWGALIIAVFLATLLLFRAVTQLERRDLYGSLAKQNA